MSQRRRVIKRSPQTKVISIKKYNHKLSAAAFVCVAYLMSSDIHADSYDDWIVHENKSIEQLISEGTNNVQLYYGAQITKVSLNVSGYENLSEIKAQQDQAKADALEEKERKEADEDENISRLTYDASQAEAEMDAATDKLEKLNGQLEEQNSVVSDLNKAVTDKEKKVNNKGKQLIDTAGQRAVVELELSLAAASLKSMPNPANVVKHAQLFQKKLELLAKASELENDLKSMESDLDSLKAEHSGAVSYQEQLTGEQERVEADVVRTETIYSLKAEEASEAKKLKADRIAAEKVVTSYEKKELDDRYIVEYKNTYGDIVETHVLKKGDDNSEWTTHSSGPNMGAEITSNVQSVTIISPEGKEKTIEDVSAYTLTDFESGPGAQIGLSDKEGYDSKYGYIKPADEIEVFYVMAEGNTPPNGMPSYMELSDNSFSDDEVKGMNYVVYDNDTDILFNYNDNGEVVSYQLWDESVSKRTDPIPISEYLVQTDGSGPTLEKNKIWSPIYDFVESSSTKSSSRDFQTAVETADINKIDIEETPFASSGVYVPQFDTNLGKVKSIYKNPIDGSYAIEYESGTYVQTTDKSVKSLYDAMKAGYATNEDLESLELSSWTASYTDGSVSKVQEDGSWEISYRDSLYQYDGNSAKILPSNYDVSSISAEINAPAGSIVDYSNILSSGKVSVSGSDGVEGEYQFDGVGSLESFKQTIPSEGVTVTDYYRPNAEYTQYKEYDNGQKEYVFPSDSDYKSLTVYQDGKEEYLYDNGDKKEVRNGVETIVYAEGESTSFDIPEAILKNFQESTFGTPELLESTKLPNGDEVKKYSDGTTVTYRESDGSTSYDFSSGVSGIKSESGEYVVFDGRSNTTYEVDGAGNYILKAGNGYEEGINVDGSSFVKDPTIDRYEMKYDDGTSEWYSISNPKIGGYTAFDDNGEKYTYSYDEMNDSYDKQYENGSYEKIDNYGNKVTYDSNTGWTMTYYDSHISGSKEDGSYSSIYPNGYEGVFDQETGIYSQKNEDGSSHWTDQDGNGGWTQVDGKSGEISENGNFITLYDEGGNVISAYQDNLQATYISKFDQNGNEYRGYEIDGVEYVESRVNGNYVYNIRNPDGTLGDETFTYTYGFPGSLVSDTGTTVYFNSGDTANEQYNQYGELTYSSYPDDWQFVEDSSHTLANRIDQSSKIGDKITTANGTVLQKVQSQTASGGFETAYIDVENGGYYYRSGNGFISEDGLTSLAWDETAATQTELERILGGSDLEQAFDEPEGVPPIDTSYNHSFIHGELGNGLVVDGEAYTRALDEVTGTEYFKNLNTGEIYYMEVNPQTGLMELRSEDGQVSHSLEGTDTSVVEYVNEGILSYNPAISSNLLFYPNDCLDTSTCQGYDLLHFGSDRYITLEDGTRQYVSYVDSDAYSDGYLEMGNVPNLYLYTENGVTGSYLEKIDSNGRKYLFDPLLGETIYADADGNYPGTLTPTGEVTTFIDPYGYSYIELIGDDGILYYYNPDTGDMLNADGYGQISGSIMVDGIEMPIYGRAAYRQYLDDNHYIFSDPDTGSRYLVDSETGKAYPVSYDENLDQYSACFGGACYLLEDGLNIFGTIEDTPTNTYDPLLYVNDEGQYTTPDGEVLPENTIYSPTTGLYSLNGYEWTPGEAVPPEALYATANPTGTVDSEGGDGTATDVPLFAGAYAPPEGEYYYDEEKNAWVLPDGSTASDNGWMWDSDLGAWQSAANGDADGSASGKCAWVYVNSGVAKTLVDGSELSTYEGPMNMIIYDATTGAISTIHNKNSGG